MKSLDYKIKITARYIILAFFMYLTYYITRTEYVIAIKDIGEVAVSAIYVSVFGALTLVLKSHMKTKISTKEPKDGQDDI